MLSFDIPSAVMLTVLACQHDSAHQSDTEYNGIHHIDTQHSDNCITQQKHMSYLVKIVDVI